MMMRLARISWISSSQRPWLRHLSMCFTYDRFDRLGSKTSPQDVAYRMHHFAVDTINFRLFHWKRKHSKWLHVFFSMFFPSNFAVKRCCRILRRCGHRKWTGSNLLAVSGRHLRLADTLHPVAGGCQFCLPAALPPCRSFQGRFFE